jgi:hypothetical protein
MDQLHVGFPVLEQVRGKEVMRKMEGRGGRVSVGYLDHRRREQRLNQLREMDSVHILFSVRSLAIGEKMRIFEDREVRQCRQEIIEI